MENKNFNYERKPIDKLIADYNRRLANGNNAFKDFEEFKNWYDGQEKTCRYCGLNEHESQEIVFTGLLLSKRFPLAGKFARGKSRGMWLELDRLNPTGTYSTTNCVLACYFCNNDKSDIFDESSYKEFQNNRVDFLRNLLVKNNDNR